MRFASLPVQVTRRWRGPALFCGAIALIAVLYLEQNWSGKRSWETCKRELETRGEDLDWNAYLPKAVPDDQNIFKAPKISQWFVRGALGGLGSRLFNGQNVLAKPVTVAEIIVVAPGSSPSTQADLVLQFCAPTLTAAGGDESAFAAASLEEPVIPLIVMDEAPLSDAIRNLARQANINYTVDQKILYDAAGKQPLVSLRWQNVTARRGLRALLNNYGFVLVTDHSGNGGRIINKGFAKPQVFADATTREKITAALSKAWTPSAFETYGSSLKGSQGFLLVARQPTAVRPARIVVQARETPDKEELAAFFPPQALSAAFGETGPLRIAQTGTNRFSAAVMSQRHSAADYLDWSDQFEPDFDMIREALKRPFARMEGDYSKPARMPCQNFVALRMLAQTLGQRAQSCLLLGEPEQALRELSLLHEVSRLLEARPSGIPTTLVAAIINVAITGVYVEVVSDGLRLHAWRDPQLRALAEQLKEVNLPPLVLQAIRTERAAGCRILETTPVHELCSVFSGKPRAGFWQKAREPEFWALSQVPRGWIYENMTTAALMHQKWLASFDPATGVISPARWDAASREIQKRFAHFSPATFMAMRMVPNCQSAWKTAAFNQTRAGEALVACALERFRLVHGNLPIKLDSLIPDFAQGLPRDLVNGQPLQYALKEKDHFALYSVGWNEVDDGGVPGRSKTGTTAIEKGDWVWQSDEASLK